MKNIDSKTFSGKIILFGEYTVLHGGEVLAVPSAQYGGAFALGGAADHPSHGVLRAFANYLRCNNVLSAMFDWAAVENDLAAGLFFDSNIPQGYGLGSSGAVCAAFFKRYVTKIMGEVPREISEIAALKQIFSAMESFFHGESSGTDPLICYLNRPVILKKQSIVATRLPVFPESGAAVCFLVNTHLPRKTAPLVKLFLEKSRIQTFWEEVVLPLKALNQRAIAAFLERRTEVLFELAEGISTLQLLHFQAMIPLDWMEIWKQGLETRAFSLKICGAGGGGFLLGFAKEWKVAQAMLPEQTATVLYYL